MAVAYRLPEAIRRLRVALGARFWGRRSADLRRKTGSVLQPCYWAEKVGEMAVSGSLIVLSSLAWGRSAP